MRVATGSFIGNGDQQFVSVGFEPDWIVLKSANASGVQSVFWQKHLFCERAFFFDATTSIANAVMPHENGFFVGSAAQVNDASQTMYWVAVADNGEGAFDTQSWMGNATTGRTITSNLTNLIKLAIVKRDYLRSGVVRSYLGNTCSFLDATSVTDNTTQITALNAGSITVGTGINVNELTGTLGEGINGIFFAGGSNSSVISWTGTGAANTVNLPLQAKAVLSFRQDAASGPRLTSDIAPTLSIPLRGSAPIATDVVMAGSQLVLGASSGLNANGVVYHAVVFGQDAGSTVKVPDVPTCAVGTGRKVVYLPGRNISSYINCGNSDATLKISGAITLEFMGQTMYSPGGSAVPAADQAILCRSNGVAGTYTTAGNFSWGFTEIAANDSALGWQSQWNIVPGQFLDITDTDATCAHYWRSGIAPKSGRFFHVVITCSATLGKWNVYLNGKLVKNRSIDMVGVNGLQNIVSGTGHTTVIGGRYNGTAVVSFMRMLFALARVYNVELTPAQALTRYQIAALGTTGLTDPASGLAEEWDAKNARGNSLPATVNSANNATIVGGTVITL